MIIQTLINNTDSFETAAVPASVVVITATVVLVGSAEEVELDVVDVLEDSVVDVLLVVSLSSKYEDIVSTLRLYQTKFEFTLFTAEAKVFANSSFVSFDCKSMNSSN